MCFNMVKEMDEIGQYLIKGIEKYPSHKRKRKTINHMSYNY